jgi:sugar phosphate isomerase/epimerase
MAPMTRRNLLQAAGAGLAAAITVSAGGAARGASGPATTGTPAPAAAAAKEEKPMKDRWHICMNTVTIKQASVEDKIKVCAAAGYDGIELWQDDLAGWEKSGKSLEDLAKRIKDAGLELSDVIGFGTSMPPAEADRPKALEDVKRRLAQAAKAGSKRIALVPTPDRADIDLLWAAQRYREILDAAKEFNVVPALEFHGFAKGIHTLGQAAAVAIEADRPEACLIADTFHMVRGGGGFRGIALTSGALYGMFHINDLPKSPGPDKVTDADRVYPGDGILPLAQMFKDLWKVGYRGPLSLEMFRQDEWKKPAADVAKTGMEKIRKVIAASGTES